MRFKYKAYYLPRNSPDRLPPGYAEANLDENLPEFKRKPKIPPGKKKSIPTFETEEANKKSIKRRLTKVE